MSVAPLHPALLRYLRRVQQETVVGAHAFALRDDDRSERTVYRWRRLAGDRLLVIPSVRAEALGLLHAHVFITDPREGCLRCPYAVESSWVSPDLVQHVLYLHCLVPALHQQRATLEFAELPAAHVSVLWSGSGWQEFIDPVKAFALPTPATSVGADPAFVRRHPLVVPVLMESWQYPNSMSMMWARMRQRDPARLRYYVRGRLHLVNGMLHVRDAYNALSAAGMVHQQVVRYHSLLESCIEVFLTVASRDALLGLVRELRDVLRAVEAYPLSHGYLCRLLGLYELMDRVMLLPPDVRQALRVLYFHTKRHPSPRVAFAYEELFDPRTGTWR